MAMKSITTFLGVEANAGDALDAAMAAAEAWDAHLDVMAAAPVDSNPAFVADIGPTALVGLYEEADRQAEAAAESAKARLQGLSAGWSIRPATGVGATVNERIAGAARFSDVTFLPSPMKDGHATWAERVFETVLFDAPAPVLLVPDGNAANPAFPKILLAWNESPQSLAAVRAAMPLLARATEVEIAYVAPPQHRADIADPGADLALWLSRHDVTAVAAPLAQSLPRVADTLLRRAEDIGADLVVMGAYGHSRFREQLLGGATRDMAAAADRPVFFGR